MRDEVQPFISPCRPRYLSPHPGLPKAHQSSFVQDREQSPAEWKHLPQPNPNRDTGQFVRFGYPCDTKWSNKVNQYDAKNSLRINNFSISLGFHRNFTAVPFTPVRPYGKQATIGVIDPNDIGFAPY
jgi:hypothetical protein